jgi:hypothetical protein
MNDNTERPNIITDMVDNDLISNSPFLDYFNNLAISINEK